MGCRAGGALLRALPRWAVRATCALALMAAAAPASAGLAERLERGETITIVALGDSLSTGFELANPERDSYPTLFRSILQRRYRRARIRMVVAGIPGETSEGGATRVERDVLPHQPDLVMVQYGGNDHAQERGAGAYRQSIETIITKIRAGSTAKILLATPPIISPTADTPMVNTAKEIAKAQGIPLADMDGAIRRFGTGPRGPFPYGRHPDIHLHAVMAGALYQAFTALLEKPQTLRAAIDPGSREVVRGEALPVNVRAWGAGKGPIAVTLECDDVRFTRTVTPGPTGGAVATFLVPPAEDGAVTTRRRLIAWARRADTWAYDVRWLAETPVVSVGEGGDVGRVVLSTGTYGAYGFAGVSGSYKVTQEGAALRFAVDVNDDRIQRRPADPNPWDSDCVEIFLDLRPARLQARPYWEPGVACLFLYPGTEAGILASWNPLEPLPDAWRAVTVTSQATLEGYRIEAVLPLALLQKNLQPGQTTVGMDIAIDDTDGQQGRKGQAVWAGEADNFLNPQLFGALALTRPADGKPRMRVSVW